MGERSSRSLGLLFLICLCAFSAHRGLSSTFPARNNTEVLYLTDPMVDFSLRADLIARATSIDIVTFAQTTDEIGMAILKAIRTAQLKNAARVRFIYESSASMWRGDFSGWKPSHIISDATLALPGQVICNPMGRKLARGMWPDDFLHQKIIILNAGTDRETIFAGGRNQWDASGRDIDSAFLIRPLDPHLEYGGTDLKFVFESRWKLMAQEVGVEPARKIETSLVDQVNVAATTLVSTDVQKNSFRHLLRVLNHPPEIGEKNLAPFQFRPRSVQLVTNDLFPQLVRYRPGRSLENRAYLDRDITRKLAQIIQVADTVDLSTYAYALPPLLKILLGRIVARGGSVNVFTNGRQAHQNYVPGGITLDYTLREILPLMQTSLTTGRGEVNLYLLDALGSPSHARALAPQYMHRKMLITKSVVVSGSDNFTQASEMKNDEMILVFDDERFADFLRVQMRRELVYYRRWRLDAAKGLFDNRPWYSDCLQPMIQLMY